RDELGIQTQLGAKPIQAAMTSAAMFTLGASMPLVASWIAPENFIIWLVASVSILSLTCLGALAAYLGGANIITGSLRVTFWGALAMLVTAITGKLFGIII
nr:VIT1/CCC1 transporter family protein [Nitrosomonas sp.]